MSYDIRLVDPVKRETLLCEIPHQMKGGTFAIGGTQEMDLNITYNYADWYYRPGVFSIEGRGGIRHIYGLTGAESIPVLKGAIKALEECKEDISDEEREECEEQGATGYWMPTRENAIKRICQLLAFAQMRPDGIWEGD